MSKVRDCHLVFRSQLRATFTFMFMLDDGSQAVSVGFQFTRPLRGISLTQCRNDSK